MKQQLGLVLLGIWLVLGGILALVPTISFPYEGTIHSVLGLVAGVLILMRR